MATERRKNVQPEDKAPQDLMQEALDAYGIAREHVFAASYDPERNTVSILTRGGVRVRYHGQKIEDKDRLDPIQVTGINPEAAKRKPIAGKAKG